MAALFACYFAFATAVQVNDPDVGAWAGFYAVCSLVSFVSVWRLPPAWLTRLLAGVAAVWALALAPGAFGSSFRELFQSWQMMSTGMEVGREFLGLLIVVPWMLYLGSRPH